MHQKWSGLSPPTPQEQIIYEKAWGEWIIWYLRFTIVLTFSPKWTLIWNIASKVATILG